MRGWIAPLVVCVCGCSSGKASGTDGGGSDGGTRVVMATQTVGASGGTVSVSDPSSPIAGASVTIPPGALPGDTMITISHVADGSPFPTDALTVGFGPSGTQFAAPVTVTVPYASQYLTDNGISDTSKLRVVTVSTEGARETLAATVDATKRLASAQVTHFSDFAALAVSKASLDGYYALLQYSQSSSVAQPNAPAQGTPLPQPLGFSSVLGSVTFDGMGGFGVTSLSGNLDGMAQSPHAMSGTYDVPSTEGLVHLGSMIGKVLADGSIAALVTTSGDPQIVLLLSKQGNFQQGMLNGDYALVQYTRFHTIQQGATPAVGTALPSPLGFANIVGDLQFDGMGGYTFQSSVGDTDGTAMAQMTQNGSYTVDADGSVTINNFQGAMVSGGRLVGLVSTSGDPALLMLVRKAKLPMLVSSLFAGYELMQYAHFSTITQANTPTPGTPLPAPLGFNTVWGVANFDGMGTITGVSLSGNQDGMSQTPSGQSMAYAFDANNDLTIGASLRGAATEDGNVFVVGAISGTPMIDIGVF